MEFHKLTSEPQSFISASQMQRLCLLDHSMIEAVDAEIISENNEVAQKLFKAELKPYKVEINRGSNNRRRDLHSSAKEEHKNENP